MLEIQGGEERVLRVRLTIAKDASDKPFGPEFEKIFQSRKDDADEFYNGVLSGRISILFPVPRLSLSSIYIFTQQRDYNYQDALRVFVVVLYYDSRKATFTCCDFSRTRFAVRRMQSSEHTRQSSISNYGSILTKSNEVEL